jgi:hypothetical protein
MVGTAAREVAVPPLTPVETARNVRRPTGIVTICLRTRCRMYGPSQSPDPRPQVPARRRGDILKTGRALLATVGIAVALSGIVTGTASAKPGNACSQANAKGVQHIKACQPTMEPYRAISEVVTLPPYSTDWTTPVTVSCDPGDRAASAAAYGHTSNINTRGSGLFLARDDLGQVSSIRWVFQRSDEGATLAQTALFQGYIDCVDIALPARA